MITGDSEIWLCLWADKNDGGKQKFFIVTNVHPTKERAEEDAKWHRGDGFPSEVIQLWPAPVQLALKQPMHVSG